MSIQEKNALTRRSVVGGAAAGAAALTGASSLDAADKGALRDGKIITRDVTFPGAGAEVRAFLARPREDLDLPAVILIPGIFGVSSYMRESTAQVAQAGLVGLCVDFYSRIGGVPASDDFAVLREAVGRISDSELIADLQAGINYLKKEPHVKNSFGVTGFCMGGRYTLLLAAQSRDIAAASPYYGPVSVGGPGRPAVMDMTESISCAVQGHYGATDRNPKPEDVKAFYEKLAKTNPHAEHFIYEGAGHAFHDFSRPAYNAQAAEIAWNRTLEFFRKHLARAG